MKTFVQFVPKRKCPRCQLVPAEDALEGSSFCSCGENLDSLASRMDLTDANNHKDFALVGKDWTCLTCYRRLAGPTFSGCPWCKKKREQYWFCEICLRYVEWHSFCSQCDQNREGQQPGQQPGLEPPGTADAEIPSHEMMKAFWYNGTLPKEEKIRHFLRMADSGEQKQKEDDEVISSNKRKRLDNNPELELVSASYYSKDSWLCAICDSTNPNQDEYKMSSVSCSVCGYPKAMAITEVLKKPEEKKHLRPTVTTTVANVPGNVPTNTTPARNVSPLSSHQEICLDFDDDKYELWNVCQCSFQTCFTRKAYTNKFGLKCRSCQHVILSDWNCPNCTFQNPFDVTSLKRKQIYCDMCYHIPYQVLLHVVKKELREKAKDTPHPQPTLITTSLKSLLLLEKESNRNEPVNVGVSTSFWCTCGWFNVASSFANETCQACQRHWVPNQRVFRLSRLRETYWQMTCAKAFAKKEEEGKQREQDVHHLKMVASLFTCQTLEEVKKNFLEGLNFMHPASFISVSHIKRFIKALESLPWEQHEEAEQWISGLCRTTIDGWRRQELDPNVYELSFLVRKSRFLTEDCAIIVNSFLIS